jgi:hypothetical protein
MVGKPPRKYRPRGPYLGRYWLRFHGFERPWYEDRGDVAAWALNIGFVTIVKVHRRSKCPKTTRT